MTTTASDLTSDTRAASPRASLGMVARYYYPRLKWQLIAYPLISVLCTAFMVWMAAEEIPFLGLIAEWILVLMIIFAPLAFARYNSRQLDIALPAPWQLKAAFLLLYTVVIVPLMVLLLPALSQTVLPYRFCLIGQFITVNNGGELVSKIIPSWLIWLQRTHIAAWGQSFLPSVLCLLFVLSFRNDTILKSVLWSLASGIIFVIIQSVLSATFIFHRLIEELDLKGGAHPTTAEIDQVTQSAVSDYLHAAYVIEIPILVAASIAVCWLVCRKVKTRNC